MDATLAGRQALVTGSSAGMGYAVARRLALAGAVVHLHGREAKHLEAARDQLAKEVPEGTTSTHAADLSDPAQVLDLLDGLEEIDILVSNTGPTHSESVLDMTPEEWSRYMDTYLTAGMLLGRHVLPGMLARGWGRVLYGAGTTCSFSPGDPDGAATMVAWLTAKSALLGLARGLAEVGAGAGSVTVNAVIPGPTHTEQSFLAHASLPDGHTYADFEREFFDGPGGSSLLRRFIDPSEFAEAVAFLVSPAASAITGATLRVDGGIIRSIAT